MTAQVEIRVLGASGIEDHHAHLLRLDPAERTDYLCPDADDHAIDSHCLRLMSAQAIVIGAYIDGVMRAAIELVPDRTARKAEALFTAENGFGFPELVKKLLSHAAEQARKYRLNELQFHGLDRDAQQSAA